MRKYETVFICDPDLQEKDRADFFERIKQIVTNESGFITNFDDWGSKKLAYEINKKPRGYYVCMTYGGDGETVKELERNFRLTDAIMKFMTIMLKKEVSMEELEEEARNNAEKPKQAHQETDSDDSDDLDEQDQDEDTEDDDSTEED